MWHLQQKRMWLAGLDLRPSEIRLKLGLYLSHDDLGALGLDVDAGQHVKKLVPLVADRPHNLSITSPEEAHTWELYAVGVQLDKWEVSWSRPDNRSEFNDGTGAITYRGDAECVAQARFVVAVPLVGEAWPGDLLSGLAARLGRGIDVYCLDRMRAATMVADLLNAVADSAVNGGYQWTVYPQESGEQQYVATDGSELAKAVLDQNRSGETLADTVVRLCLGSASTMDKHKLRKLDNLRAVAKSHASEAGLDA
jgi:hypothetical protein